MVEQERLQPMLIASLSQDELSFLMRALGLGRLASFVIPPDFDESAASAASRSLRARGLAGLSPDGKYQIDQGVATIIVAAASFSRVLTVTHEDAEGRKDNWFYFTPGLTVQHRQTQPGVQVFQTVPDGMSMLMLLADAMGMAPLRETNAQDMQVVLNKAAFDAAQAAVNQGESDQAYQILKQAGTAEQIAQAIAYPNSRSVISLITPQPEESPIVDGLMILDAESGYWILQPYEEDLLAQSVTAERVLDRIADMLVPAS